MSDGQPSPKRVRLTKENLNEMTKEEILIKWHEQEAYIEATGVQKAKQESTDHHYDEAEVEKWKTQVTEATRRENVLVKRLASKEHEIQECMTQIQELKQANNPSSQQLRSMMLDPAVNLMFQRMKKEMDTGKEKLEQAQNDLAAWKFTPDSQMGKRLMARCRVLLQENEELGKVISAGRTAKLEGEITLEKTLVQEMKKSQAEMDEFLVELDEDVEGMQSTIYFLQQELKDSKEQIVHLEQENQTLRTQLASNNASMAGDGGNHAHAQSHRTDDGVSSYHRQTTNGGSHHPMDTDVQQEAEPCEEYRTSPTLSPPPGKLNNHSTALAGQQDLATDVACSPKHKRLSDSSEAALAERDVDSDQEMACEPYRTDSHKNSNYLQNGVPESDSSQGEEEP